MPADFKITTELLYKGALAFALVDLIYIPLLAWRVRKEAFRSMKWSLVIAAAWVWFGIWSWAIDNFWESVYSYVFPAWARTWVPWIALSAAGAVALGLWALATRNPVSPIMSFCLMGGALGSLTHIWAVQRGLVSRPPLLQGSSPLAAVVIAFFEYMFYWCVILTLARAMDWLRRSHLKASPVPS